MAKAHRVRKRGLVEHTRHFFATWSAESRAHLHDAHISVSLLFVVAGALIGLTAAAFSDASQQVEDLQQAWAERDIRLAWVVMPLGLTLVVLLVRVFFDGTAGSGIPLLSVGIELQDGDPNFVRVFSLRILFGKILLTLLAQLCGASSGREGPTVQVASILLVTTLRVGYRLLPWVRQTLDLQIGEGLGTYRSLYMREAAVVGSAAGISGAFNTPLGGIIFAIEEMGNRYTHTLGHVMIIAVAVAGAVSIAVEGYHVIFDGFDQDRDDLNEYEILWVVPLVAIPSGLLGGLWAVGLLLGVHVKRLLLAYGFFAPYAISLACGLALAATGFWTGGETWGSGFRQARAVLVPELEGFPDEAGPFAAGVQPSRLFFLLNAVATWLSFWSGIPGGIFAPSIAIGTGFGAFMHDALIQPAMRGTLIMDTGPHRPGAPPPALRAARWRCEDCRLMATTTIVRS